MTYILPGALFSGVSVLGKLFSGGLFRSGGATQDPPCADRLLYAIGDVHGRIDLLMPLVDRVFQDAVAEMTEDGVPAELVFVGDVIDRGPDSRSVVELLATILDWPEIEPIFLVGNHELMLLQFLNDPVNGRRWLRHGGYETLVSYGLNRIGDMGDPDQLHRIADDLRGEMGSHLSFVENLRPWHLNGNVLLTHAGADPLLPPSQQPIEALVWGTPDFLKTRREDGLWVVHGHNVVETPTVRHGRIPIDTGAYKTGRLTALKIKGEEVSFLTETGDATADAQDDWVE